LILFNKSRLDGNDSNHYDGRVDYRATLPDEDAPQVLACGFLQ